MAKKHLYEIDLMRAFIMLGVLSVHTITIFMGRLQDLSIPYLIIGALHTTMHYTRESFMFITGLVLFATYYRHEFNVWKFWRKRFTLIAIPYVVWNIIYVIFDNLYTPTVSWSLASFWHQLSTSLLTGNQFYLYYVLVTLQLYFIFPLLLYGLRKTERWHIPILTASFLLELVFMYFNKYPLPAFGHLPAILNLLWVNRNTFVLTYQFWFIAGGIVFCHYEKIKAFLESHGKQVVWVLSTGLVLVWAHYFFDRLILHQSETIGEMVLQPIMIPYSFIVTLAILLAGIKWQYHHEEAKWRNFNRFIRVASSTSFGIFLFQPFPLTVVRNVVSILNVPEWLFISVIPAAVLFVYFSGMLFTYWIEKIPVIAYSVGRKVSLFPAPRNRSANDTRPQKAA